MPLLVSLINVMLSEGQSHRNAIKAVIKLGLALKYSKIQSFTPQSNSLIHSVIVKYFHDQMNRSVCFMLIKEPISFVMMYLFIYMSPVIEYLMSILYYF